MIQPLWISASYVFFFLLLSESYNNNVSAFVPGYNKLQITHRDKSIVLNKGPADYISSEGLGDSLLGFEKEEILHYLLCFSSISKTSEMLRHSNRVEGVWFSDAINNWQRTEGNEIDHNLLRNSSWFNSLVSFLIEKDLETVSLYREAENNPDLSMTMKVEINPMRIAEFLLMAREESFSDIQEQLELILQEHKEALVFAEVCRLEDEAIAKRSRRNLLTKPHQQNHLFSSSFQTLNLFVTNFALERLRQALVAENLVTVWQALEDFVENVSYSKALYDAIQDRKNGVPTEEEKEQRATDPKLFSLVLTAGTGVSPKEAQSFAPAYQPGSPRHLLERLLLLPNQAQLENLERGRVEGNRAGNSQSNRRRLFPSQKSLAEQNEERRLHQQKIEQYRQRISGGDSMEQGQRDDDDDQEEEDEEEGQIDFGGPDDDVEVDDLQSLLLKKLDPSMMSQLFDVESSEEEKENLYTSDYQMAELGETEESESFEVRERKLALGEELMDMRTEVVKQLQQELAQLNSSFHEREKPTFYKQMSRVLNNEGPAALRRRELLRAGELGVLQMRRLRGPVFIRSTGMPLDGNSTDLFYLIHDQDDPDSPEDSEPSDDEQPTSATTPNGVYLKDIWGLQGEEDTGRTGWRVEETPPGLEGSTTKTGTEGLRQRLPVSVMDPPGGEPPSRNGPVDGPPDGPEENDADRNLVDFGDIDYADISLFRSLGPGAMVRIIGMADNEDDGQRYICLEGKIQDIRGYQVIRAWVRYSDAIGFLDGSALDKSESRKSDSDSDAGGGDSPFFGGGIPVM